MSDRTAERNKGVRKAWEREKQLVSSGEGTRDWTPNQQRSILDIGVALDDNGRAFDGQHMKSVFAYPEYADNPDNIQFLTKQEHFEAHDRNWRNQTNWYYDPITKEKHIFGDDLIPCQVIRLSEPIIRTSASLTNTQDYVCEAVGENVSEPKTTLDTRSDSSQEAAKQQSVRTRIHGIKTAAGLLMTKGKSGLAKVRKGVGRYVIDHREEIIETVFSAAVGGVFYKATSKTNRENGNGLDVETSKPQSSNAGIVEKNTSIVEKAQKSSPREHEVPGHGQHYHTKEGVIWKEKAPYPRGGRK